MSAPIMPGPWAASDQCFYVLAADGQQVANASTQAHQRMIAELPNLMLALQQIVVMDGDFDKMGAAQMVAQNALLKAAAPADVVAVTEGMGADMAALRASRVALKKALVSATAALSTVASTLNDGNILEVKFFAEMEHCKGVDALQADKVFLARK